MPNFGGFCPLPLRLGGGESRLREIYESLNDGLGTAYDTSDTSPVTAETEADASTIEAVWSANERLKNQWDPNALTDFLTRWEKIFGLSPKRTDSDNLRRAKVALKFRALGGAVYATLDATCTAFLGPAFVQIEYTDLAHMHTHWPGGTPAELNMWSSSLAHILIRVTQATALTFHEFIGRLSDLMAFLGDVLPVWVTVDWGTLNSLGNNGFLLDEPNLDLETFDA